MCHVVKGGAGLKVRHMFNSAVLSVLNQHFHCGNHPVAEDCPCAGLEIGPFDRTRSRWRSRHQVAQHNVPLTDFDLDARLQPGFDLTGITELSEGYFAFPESDTKCVILSIRGFCSHGHGRILHRYCAALALPDPGQDPLPFARFPKRISLFSFLPCPMNVPLRTLIL